MSLKISVHIVMGKYGEVQCGSDLEKPVRRVEEKGGVTVAVS